MNQGRLLTTLSILLACASPVAGQVDDLSCVSGNRPGATLLFPYFEVDLANPQARSTLMSINNVAATPVLTNVVMWTNCGIPALDFPLYLKGNSTTTVNLRDIVISGQIPQTGPAPGNENPANCSVPVAPHLDADERARLRARLTGQPDPQDGLCYTSLGNQPQVVTGYLTVDTVDSCSDTVRTPVDPGYFPARDGRATSDNVLWGDFFLVDNEGDNAQGFEAVARVARPFSGDAAPAHTFYGKSDDRQPLSSRFRTRFFTGGDFDGGTELIVWTQRTGLLDPAPAACEEIQYTCETFNMRLFAQQTAESGENTSSDVTSLPRTPYRLQVGSEELPTDVAFGSLDLDMSFDVCPICSPPLIAPVQSWVLPIYRASGRFSVGLGAVQLGGFCEGIE